MVAFKRILFPIDLSEAASAIVPYVHTLADKFNSEIHVLFAVSAFDKYAAFYVPHSSIDNMKAEALKGAKRKMDEFITEFFKGNSSIRSVVVIGDAANEIIKYVQSAKIDLVIMGTHGKEGLRCFMFGSVAEKVIKNVEIPVLSIHQA